MRDRASPNLKRFALHAKATRMLLPEQDENCTRAPGPAHTAQLGVLHKTKRTTCSHSDRAPFVAPTSAATANILMA